MCIQELFSGVAVVIDDQIDDSTANINNIVRQIESANIPVLKYDSLPDDTHVNNFKDLSFLLLDWNFVGEEGVSVPDAIINENIQFLTELNTRCFCPVFIFTNEATDTIKTKLEEEELIADDTPSNIFILSKSELQEDGTLFSYISDWLVAMPSVYVLKEWEKEYHNCKTKLFSELHSINPCWPTIMWKNFEADGANKSLEMGELISRNLHSRMTPFEFKDDILNVESNIPRDELRKVLEGERFLKQGNLCEDDISTGDLFKEEYQDNGETKIRYYLNIRAQCDLLRSRNLDNVELYCLRGRIVSEESINVEGGTALIEGQFIEKTNNSIIPFLDNGKIIEFLFRDIKQKKWRDLKQNRIGRLLPPYINKVQQRYALYMQRQGLPRIPSAAVFEQ